MNIFLTALFLMVSSLSFAQSKSKMTAKKNLKPEPAITKLDVAGELKWTGYGVGKSHHGSITLKSGFVEFKGANLTGGTFLIDMPTLKTGDSPKLEGHLKAADFFDVEKFKESTFRITQVEAIANAKAGEATHKITGELTIKGKTNIETFSATITKTDKAYTAVAKTQIPDRTKYDIIYRSGKFQAASALGDKLIKDEFDIEIDLKTK